MTHAINIAIAVLVIGAGWTALGYGFWFWLRGRHGDLDEPRGNWRERS